VGASAFLEARQGAAADAAITEGNVVASVTSLLATFAVGVAATTVLGWRAGMALLVVMAIALEVARGRRLAAFDVGTQAERIAPRSRLPSLMWWAILTLILLTSVELTLLQWGADLLRERGGLGAAAASASISAIVTGMILGRLVGSRIVERISGERVFAGAIILAAVGFLFTLLVAGPLLMILGFLITGSGIGMHFPLGISRAMRASAGQPDRAAGLTSAGIGIVSGIAPFFLAALADAWGIRTAFAVMLACFVVSFILLLANPVPEEQVSGPSATRSPQ
jgi:fucose permease